MEGPRLKIISQNIASSRKVEKISDIIKRSSPDLLLMQEVTLSTAQLKEAVQDLQYDCEANIDPENPTFPGTAVVWRVDLDL